MEELNVPGYHKVVADKANVPVEYAAGVINDFVRANDPDEDEFSDLNDDEQGMAEGAPISGDGGAVDNFRQQMANNTELAYQSGMAEAKKKSEPPEADYGADYQDMVSRVKKLAGMGPLKTQYDPARRVYRNMPTAVQPKK
jgi:hypothetical protein